ncbi:MAG: DUF5977 domain-containing protein [Bacteroidota bacterium]|nr:DUF5977 domain-containing protein [Bacteroidota bacterium]
MKISTKLALVALFFIFIFNGCKKDSHNSVPKVADKSLSVTDTGMVMTPFGPRLKSDVHFVEDGYALSNIDGHLKKVQKQTGKVMLDFGAQAPLKYLTVNNVQGHIGKQLVSMSNSNNATVPGLGSGWITDAYWSNNTGLALTYFNTNWVVPSNPTTYHSQLVYLFNGLQDGFTSTSHILQPVLQFGPNGAWGGNYWTIDNWYASCQTCTAYYGTAVTVTSGTTLHGLMQQTAVSGTNYSYNSSFVGYPTSSSLQINNVPQLYWAAETLEAYSLTQASDYPPDLNVAMSSIQIKTGTTTPTISWTAENRVTDVGQHTIVASNSNPSGEVDLYFRMATNPLMSQVFYKNNCTTGQGSGVAYVVPAGKYSATTQAAANALAQTEINNNGQAYANANGTCNQPYTFGVMTTNANPTWFMLIVNGQNISGPRGTAPQNQINNVSSTMNTSSNSTVVMQITSGYMPVSATLNGPFPTNHGVISGSNITFTGVNLSIGSSCGLTIN